MPRYAAIIEYDGTPFSGFQKQAGCITVQGVMEGVIRILEGDFIQLVGAGRTDSGVHANGQVIHFDLKKDWEISNLNRALNGNLHTHPITLLETAKVHSDFHARFSAINRKYIYRLVSRVEPLVFDRAYAWQKFYPLDLEAMRLGAKHLIGKHDFTTFRSSQCQSASPIKTLDSITITKSAYPNGWEFQFSFEAKSYLHKQIRSIVGTLERVGAGKWKPDDVKLALLNRSRAACAPLAKPYGLYLASIQYNPNPFNATFNRD